MKFGQILNPAIFIIILSLLTSCKETKARFEISNASGVVLDSVSIKASTQSAAHAFVKMKPGERVSFWLSMEGIPQADGNYSLSYKPADKKNFVTNHFGYFSNGIPAEKITKIIIERDTVIFDFVYQDSYQN